jgi:hypothetical protein
MDDEQSASRIDQAAKGVPATLHLTGKAPFPDGLSSKKARDIMKRKIIWEDFLRARPSQNPEESIGSG